MNIADVRKALWDAYEKCSKHPNFCPKPSEAWVEVCYPAYFSCDTHEEFGRPIRLMVYSYALGPSRQHHFILAKKESRPDSATWETRDIFAKAVEVINGWAAEFGNEDAA